MAIKEVKVIPNAYKKTATVGQMVRKDLEEALDKRISKFEFDGDYNYKTLGYYVRREAEWIFNQAFWCPASTEVEEALAKELGRDDIHCERFTREYKQAFDINGVTQSDRMHVYVEIDFNFLDNYKSELMTRTRRKYGLHGSRKGTG